MTDFAPNIASLLVDPQIQTASLTLDGATFVVLRIIHPVHGEINCLFCDAHVEAVIKGLQASQLAVKKFRDATKDPEEKPEERLN